MQRSGGYPSGQLFTILIFLQMNNLMKVSGQWCVKLSFLLLLMLPASIGVSVASVMPTTPVAAVMGCDDPSGITKTGQWSHGISFSWTGESGAIGYKVYYVRLSDNYTSSVITTGSTSISFSGLDKGDYHFFFATEFVDRTSDYVVVEDLIM